MHHEFHVNEVGIIKLSPGFSALFSAQHQLTTFTLLFSIFSARMPVSGVNYFISLLHRTINWLLCIYSRSVSKAQDGIGMVYQCRWNPQAVPPEFPDAWTRKHFTLAKSTTLMTWWILHPTQQGPGVCHNRPSLLPLWSCDACAHCFELHDCSTKATIMGCPAWGRYDFSSSQLQGLVVLIKPINISIIIATWFHCLNNRWRRKYRIERVE